MHIIFSFILRSVSVRHIEQNAFWQPNGRNSDSGKGMGMSMGQEETMGQTGRGCPKNKTLKLLSTY